MKHFKNIIALSCATIILSGCAREIDSDIYTEDSVNNTYKTYKGTISSCRIVKVQASDKLEGNRTGIGVGAVVGGIAGSTMGGGRGKVATTAIGAVAGGVLGSIAEKKLKTQNALECLVDLSDGTFETVVQSTKEEFSPGQRVLLLKGKGRDSRSRITADRSPY